MPTAEAKSQAKPEKPKEIEEVSQPPLEYKVWVLKVRIHCEGCIKEVEKILKKIDGVYRTDSDGKMGNESKVTVTGNVEPEILIKALAKGEKHAELWPGQKANNSKNSNDKKKNKGKNEKQQGEDAQGSDDGNHGESGGGGSCDIEGETVEAEVVQVQDNGGKKKNEGGSGAGRSKGRRGVNAVKLNRRGGAAAKAGGGGGGGRKGKEVKVEAVRQGEPVNMSEQPAAAQKCFGGDYDEDDSHCEVEKSRGGGGGRGGASSSRTKKTKKGQKGTANADDSDEDAQCGDAAPPRTGSLPYHGNVPRGPPIPQGPYMSNWIYAPCLPPYGSQGSDFAPAPAPTPAFQMAPHQQMYEYYQYPRQKYIRLPIQAMNLNTDSPASSYGVSQHVAPLPHAHSYTYASHSVAAETEPPSHQSNSYPQYHTSLPAYNPPQQSDSFGLFSEENPNGCSIV